MKQIVLMSAFSALMLMFTGCSEDKIIDDNPGGGLNSDQISLNVYTENNTTRATDAVIGSNFTNFQVYAMNGTTSLLAPNTTYTYSSANSKWAFSGTAPNWTDASFQTFPIRFFALADNASTNTLYNVTTTPALTYSYTSPAFANQVDLLAAITTIQRKPVGGTVPFPFKHALSKVKMRVEVGAGVKLILKSLTLKNLKNSATLTFNAASDTISWTPGTTRYDVAYVNKPTAGQETVYDNTAGSTSRVMSVFGTYTSSDDSTQAAMLLPQTTNAWDLTGASYTTPPAGGGAAIEMVYRMEDASGNNLIGFKPDPTATPSRPAYFVKVAFPLYTGSYSNATGALTWNQNFSYTYSVPLGTTTSFDGIVVSNQYIDGSGLTVTGPVVRIPAGGTDNNDPSKGELRNVGDPITRNDIQLNVTVNRWGSDTPISISR